ncbi:hypothetical protein AUP68_02753 [Ilyonectria robusta]
MASSAPQRDLSYQPLSAASNEIRILSIKPAKRPQDEIKCQLEHVPLAASSNYVALSYCWGGSDKTVPVRVNNQITHVTPSLASALTEIRSRGHVKVWADAICINQDDDEERSHQVLRMAAIYRSAHAVIAWLGHAEPPAVQGVIHLMGAIETLLGFNDRRDKLQRLGGGSGHDILSEAKLQDSKTPDGQKLRQRALRRVVRGVVKLLDKNTSQDLHPVRKTKGALKHIRANLQDSHWEALERLLSCEYWSRVWVIQELSMANRLQVIWGSHKFAFLDLAYLAVAYRRMRKADMVGDIVSPRACRHIQNLLKFKNLQSGLKAVPLIKALKMTSFARSTDVRDKVYGLMGLTYDGSIIFPTPSYGSDIRRVNEDATLRIIRLERSLDTIVFRSKSPRSWLVDWFDSETWLDPRVVSYLDGTMEFRSRNGTLCSKWDATPSSLPVAIVQGQHLVVQGSILDTVGNCSATFEERRSKSKQLPDYGGRRNIRLVKEKSHRSIEFALFNCFCILPDDETRDLSQPGFLMGMQFVSDTIISKRKVRTDLGKRASDILEWLDCPMNSSFKIRGHSLRSWFSPRPVSQWDYSRFISIRSDKTTAIRFRAIFAATDALRMGMRLGETTKGNVGWFSKHSRPRDYIAILSGSSVPVVLRPRTDGTYTVVGDSIIPSMMLGDASYEAKWSNITLH